MRVTRFLQLLALSAPFALYISCSQTVPQPIANVMAAFPAPEELARGASARAPGWTQDGASWDPALPNNSVVANGTAAVFTPTGTADLAGYAFATYAFDVTNYNGGAVVTPTINGSADELYIGIANFTENRWEWE